MGAFILLTIVTAVGVALFVVAGKVLGIQELDGLIARARKALSRGNVQPAVPAAPRHS